jgi:hypothetical protein
MFRGKKGSFLLFYHRMVLFWRCLMLIAQTCNQDFSQPGLSATIIVSQPGLFATEPGLFATEPAIIGLSQD